MGNLLECLKLPPCELLWKWVNGELWNYAASLVVLGPDKKKTSDPGKVSLRDSPPRTPFVLALVGDRQEWSCWREALWVGEEGVILEICASMCWAEVLRDTAEGCGWYQRLECLSTVSVMSGSQTEGCAYLTPVISPIPQGGDAHIFSWI